MDKTTKIIWISALALLLLGIGIPYGYYTKTQSDLFKIGYSNKQLEALRSSAETTFNIYLKREVLGSQAETFKSLLQNQPWASSVVYVSSEQQLEYFKGENVNNPIISQSLNELDKNSLPSKIELRTKDCLQNQIVEDFLQKKEFYSLIERITYPSACEKSGI